MQESKIERIGELISKLNADKSKIGETGNKVLKAFINHGKMEINFGGTEFYCTLQSVNDKLKLEEDKFNIIIFKLFLVGMISIVYDRNEAAEQTKGISTETEEDKATVFAAYEILFNKDRYSTTLTEKGRLALLSILTSEQEIMNITIEKNQEELKKEVEGANGQIVELNKLTKDFQNKIKNFYKENIAVIALIVSIVPIITVNLTTIPNLDKEEFIINIVAINVSIAFSILTIFIILSETILEKTSKLLKRIWIGIIMILVVLICINVFNKININLDLNKVVESTRTQENAKQIESSQQSSNIVNKQ